MTLRLILAVLANITAYHHDVAGTMFFEMIGWLSFVPIIIRNEQKRVDL